VTDFVQTIFRLKHHNFCFCVQLTSHVVFCNLVANHASSIVFPLQLQFNMGIDYLCRDVRLSDCNFVGSSKGVVLQWN
jgi:hypothetical protein